MRKWSVSTIIITHNNETIYDCINHINRQMDSCDEIIIVDDNSDKKYAIVLNEYCKQNAIALLHPQTPGNRAHNRNLGAEQARNPILLFVDADMLLLDTAISAIKSAYATRDNVAYIGMRSAGRYDPLRMAVVSGIDIHEVLNRNEQIAFLSDIPVIKDTRANVALYSKNLTEQKYYWIYYYTCCCTVLRDLFYQIGGFDECYTGWGVEDIDLGYRISLVGKLDFLYGFGGIHIPHDRELIYAEQDNCKNLKYLLRKAQRFDVEFISVYRISVSQLVKVKQFLSHMQMLNLPTLYLKEKSDILYVNTPSLYAPYGEVVHFDSTGKKETYNLLGISTFFDDKTISKIIVSSNVVLYPISILCGILQECLRIGKSVFIDGKRPNYRLDWSDFPNLTLIQPQKRNEYRIHDLMELQFKQTSCENRIEVTSNYLTLELPKRIPAKILYSQIGSKAIFNRLFCVINLTRGLGYRILLEELENRFRVRYTGIYSVSENLSSFEPITRFPEHLYSLLSLHISVLLIIEDINHFCFDFSKWMERSNTYDMVIDCNGKVKVF